MATNPHDLATYPYKFEGQYKHTDEFDYAHSLLEKIEAIHVVLQSINKALYNPPHDESVDQRWKQTFYKSGFGGNWLLQRFERLYLYMAAPVATALNVTSPLGAPFVLTVPAITLPSYWNLVELPEMSSIILDSTATANQMNVHMLVTNKKL